MEPYHHPRVAGFALILLVKGVARMALFIYEWVYCLRKYAGLAALFFAKNFRPSGTRTIIRKRLNTSV